MLYLAGRGLPAPAPRGNVAASGWPWPLARAAERDDCWGGARAARRSSKGEVGMRDRSVLICGAGIAGPALAYWLLRYGFTPTLVERAKETRTGGYLIDLWGAGYDLVERMGLLPEVTRAGACVNEVRLVNGRGKRVGGFDGHALQAVTGGRYTSLPRGALAN